MSYYFVRALNTILYYIVDSDDDDDDDMDWWSHYLRRAGIPFIYL